MKNYALLLYLLVLLIVNNSFSQSVGTATVNSETGRRMISKTLPNGFSYVLTRNISEPGKAVFRFTVDAGFLNETKEQYQAAHLLEHLLLANASTDRNESLNDFFRSKNMILGQEYNASTGFSQTSYTFRINSLDKELCLGTLDYFQSWLKPLPLNEAVVTAQRGAVLSEARLSRMGADNRTSSEFTTVALKGSTMGDIAAVDPIKKIPGLTKENVEQFYRSWYQPNRSFLVVCGDIDLFQLDEIIQYKFGSLTNNDTKEIRIIAPLKCKPSVHFISDSDKVDTDIEFIFKSKRPIGSSEPLKTQIISRLFNKLQELRSGRIRRHDPKILIPIIRYEDNFIMPETDLSAFRAGLTIKVFDSLQSALYGIAQCLEQLRRYGFSEQEWRTAITELTKEIELEIQTNEKTAILLAEQDKDRAPFRISGEYLKEVSSIISGITLLDFNKSIANCIDTSNYDVFIFSSNGNENHIPTIDSVQRCIRTSRKSEILQTSSALPAYKSLSDQIRLSRIKSLGIRMENDTAIGVHQFILSTGIRIILKPTIGDPLNKRILMRAFSKRNDSNATSEVRGQEMVAAQVVKNSGVGTLTKNELSEIIAGKEISMLPYINSNFAGFEGSAAIGEVEALFQLMYLYLYSPKIDSLVLYERIEGLKSEIQSKNSIDDSIKSYLSIIPGFDRIAVEDLHGITCEHLLKVYKNIFSNIDNLTIILAGNFRLEQIKSLLLKYASNIRLKKTIKRNPVNQEEKEMKFVYPANRILRSQNIKDALNIELRFTGHFEYNIKNKIAAAIVENIIHERLFRRLREQEGGTYFVNTGVFTRKYPQPSFTFQIGFESSVETKDKLIRATWEEIDRLKNNMPTEKEMELARISEGEDLSARKVRTSFWINYLEAQVKNHDGLDEVATYPEIINLIQPSDIPAFISRYLTNENFYQLEYVR